MQKLAAGLNICLARGFVITCTGKVQSVFHHIQTALGGNAGLFMLSRLQVTFSRSGKTWHWNPATASLLEFAEEEGIRIDAGCRAGNCGTCLVAVKSGEVEYLAEHGANAEGGSCLTCICKPKSNLVLDA